jgi:hypothetical protein
MIHSPRKLFDNPVARIFQNLLRRVCRYPEGQGSLHVVLLQGCLCQRWKKQYVIGTGLLHKHLAGTSLGRIALSGFLRPGDISCFVEAPVFI